MGAWTDCRVIAITASGDEGPDDRADRASGRKCMDRFLNYDTSFTCDTRSLLLINRHPCLMLPSTISSRHRQVTSSEFSCIHRLAGVLPTIAYFRTLVLMLAVGESRRTPYLYRVLLILLLTRELYKNGEHAYDLQ